MSLFFAFLSRHFTVVGQFLNIVYQAEELPLSLYFLFSAQTKAIELFIRSDIAEYRFHYRHSMAVNMFSFVTIDSLLHPIRVVRFTVALQDKGNLSAIAFSVIG